MMKMMDTNYDTQHNTIIINRNNNKDKGNRTVYKLNKGLNRIPYFLVVVGEKHWISRVGEVGEEGE